MIDYLSEWAMLTYLAALAIVVAVVAALGWWI
jgi:hypothetical protein